MCLIMRIVAAVAANNLCNFTCVLAICFMQFFIRAEAAPGVSELEDGKVQLSIFRIIRDLASERKNSAIVHIRIKNRLNSSIRLSTFTEVGKGWPEVPPYIRRLNTSERPLGMVSSKLEYSWEGSNQKLTGNGIPLTTNVVVPPLSTEIFSILVNFPPSDGSYTLKIHFDNRDNNKAEHSYNQIQNFGKELPIFGSTNMETKVLIQMENR